MFRSQSDHHQGRRTQVCALHFTLSTVYKKPSTHNIENSGQREVHTRAYDTPDDGHFLTETYVG